MVKNGCYQYCPWTLKLTVSQEWTDGITDFLSHQNTDSEKLKADQNFLSVHGPKWVWPVWWWNSKTGCIWRMNRWNHWFFACWYRFTKIKCWLEFFGWAWSEIGMTVWSWALKLTVSQQWADGINWIFACWYKFKKAIKRFNDFWVGMVKNCHRLLVYETLKSVVS